MPKIAIEDCKPGYLYRVNARGYRLGIFIAQHPTLRGCPGFIGIANDCGFRVLATELHYDADPHYGTAEPIEELVRYPGEIPDNWLEDANIYDVLHHWLLLMEKEYHDVK